MIVNDLIQSLDLSKKVLSLSPWSLSQPRSPKNVSCLVFMIVNDLFQKMHRVWSSWSSMIFFKDSVVQICYYLVSMITNNLLKSLCRPNMFFIWSLWSSMISCKASVAQKCMLFGLHDRQWSSTKPRSPKYVSHLDSMIVNGQWSLAKPRSS